MNAMQAVIEIETQLRQMRDDHTARAMAAFEVNQIRDLGEQLKGYERCVAFVSTYKVGLAAKVHDPGTPPFTTTPG